MKLLCRMREVGLVVTVKSWCRDLWNLNVSRSLWSWKLSFALQKVVLIVIK